MAYFFIIFLLFFMFKKRASIYVIKLKKYLIPIFIILFLICIVCFSSSSLETAKKSFSLWANNVVPSLLPFFICIELLKQTNFMQIVGKALNSIMYPLFNVPGSGAFALAMGITSGYPVGAKVSKDLYTSKLCSKTEAERLISFTNSSGPLFIIGAIGSGMFLDSKIGLLLFITHFIASITVGIIFRNYKKTNTTSDIIPQVSIKSNNYVALNLQNLGKYMEISIQNSISTLLMILGYMVFFSVLFNVLSNTCISYMFCYIIEKFLNLFNISKGLSSGIFAGILEITNGINSISTLYSVDLLEKLPIVAFILGFGGFSVHMQVASILSDSDLSLKPYLIGKLLQGIFACLYTFLLMKFTNFFNLTVIESFSYNTSDFKIVSESSNLVVSLALVFVLSLVLQIIKKLKKVLDN